MPMLQTALTLIPILGGTRAPSAPPRATLVLETGLHFLGRCAAITDRGRNYTSDLLFSDHVS